MLPFIMIGIGLLMLFDETEEKTPEPEKVLTPGTEHAKEEPIAAQPMPETPAKIETPETPAQEETK